MTSSMFARPVSVRASGWSWRHATRRQPSLNDLKFDIAAGEHVLLLGPSGAGKSSLLAALAGVLSAEDGEATGQLLIDGEPAETRLSRPGLVLQDPVSQIVLSRIGDEVAFGAENIGVPAAEIAGRVSEALTAVGLALPLDAATATLSGGQQQRLALATALAMQPGLLLLDEPTANVDPAGAIAVRDAVAASSVDRTLIVVEHRVDLWLPVIDRVLVLGTDGRLIADGPPQRVLAEQVEILRQQGIWLPGETPKTTGQFRPLGESVLLAVDRLAIGRPAQSPVQHDLQSSIHDGEIVWLGGPNSSGKTTLLHTLGGLLSPRQGGVRAAAEWAPNRIDRRRARLLPAGDARRSPFAWHSGDLAERIGSVFQHPEHQFAAATVREELTAAGDRRDALLSRLGLVSLADAHPTSLSGGQKRRLSVAIALARRPRLLLLDEPTFGQDALTWASLVELLLEYQCDGGTLLFASHDEPLAQRIASRRWMLSVAAEVER